MIRQLLPRTFFILLIAVLGVTLSTQAQGQLYWNDQGRTTFETANVDGSEHQVLSTGASPVLIAFDEMTERVYYIDSFNGIIYRSYLDGTGTETLVDRAYVTSTGFTSDAFVVDDDGEAMYWAEPDSNRIRTANLDGSGVSDLITADDGLGYPYGLALDTENGHLYFINGEADKIQRANLDGSNVEDVITDENAAIGLAVDPEGGKLYWSRPREGEIKRANLDGTDDEVIIGASSRFGQPALTLAGDWLYFNEPGGFTGGGAIHRARLDGTDLEEIVSGEDANDPTDLVAAGDQLYWAGGYLRRSALDGANPERILTAFPQVVKVDAEAGWAFWLNQTRELVRARLDGSDQTVLLDDLPVSNLDRIALDHEAQHVYYTGGGVYRVDYDGQTMDTLATNEPTTTGIAVDPDDETVYWIGNSSSTFAWLKRITYDGTGEETLLENLNYARSLAVDASGGTLYWIYGGPLDEQNGIRQANLDGSDSTTVLATSGAPGDLTLGADGSLYWTDPEAGSIRRTDPDDGTTEALVTGLDAPFGLDVTGTTGTAIEAPARPTAAYQLSPAHPNPLTERTHVTLAVPQSQHVRLDVYDVLGRRVATLHEGRLASGREHRFTLEAGDLPSGVYFLRATGEGFTATRQMVRVR